MIDSRSPIQDQIRKKALIIAVSEYEKESKLKPLPFCKNDGETLHEVLNAQDYDITAERRLVGRVEGSSMKKSTLDFFLKDVHENDQLLFYFSGHGVSDGFGNFYLTPSNINIEIEDEEGLRFQELELYMTKSPAKRVVVILDCCYAGALGVKNGGDEDLANMARDATDRIFRDTYGRCILASSLPSQSSYAMADNNYSKFTYHLIEGLRGGDGEAVNLDGQVTISTLGRYVYMKMGGARQRPITKTSMSGEIVLAAYADLAPAGFKRSFQVTNKHLITLLREQKVAEFNIARSVDMEMPPYLSGADLSFTDLSTANLSNAILTATEFFGANLSHAKLSHAEGYDVNFSGANLSSAILQQARLPHSLFPGAYIPSADFSLADISDSNLFNCNLTDTNLRNTKIRFANIARANLTGVHLGNADVTMADLSRSVLLAVNGFNYLACYGANFEHALIDSRELVSFLKGRGAKNVPSAIETIPEIESELKKRGFSEQGIENIASMLRK